MSPRFLRLSLVVLALLCGPVRAVDLLSGPGVEISSTNTAILHWVTDVPARGRVQWGPASGKRDHRTDGPVTNRHTITLSGLIPGTRYDFVIGTARQNLATNSFVAGSTQPTPPTTSAPTAPGPTNLPPASPPSPTSPRAPPTRETWGQLSSLPDHFDRHGRDFNAKDPDDYARMAWEFLQRARKEGLPMKIDETGVLRVFDPKTRAFGAYNRNGTTRTFFKPESRDYFDRQPGRPVGSKPGATR